MPSRRTDKENKLISEAQQCFEEMKDYDSYKKSIFSAASKIRERKKAAEDKNLVNKFCEYILLQEESLFINILKPFIVLFNAIS
jgi:hypothetical protein